MGNPREYHTQQVHYIRKTLTFSDQGTEVVVGWLPSGAVIHKAASGTFVSTAFDGTSPVLDIGANTGNDDPDEWATDLALGTTTFVPLDEAIGTYLLTADTEVTATIGGSGAAAGSCEVLIVYIPDNDG